MQIEYMKAGSFSGALKFFQCLSFILTCLSVDYNKAISNYTKFDDWYLWVQMYKGTVSMPVFQSLEAYWPGLQVRSDEEQLCFNSGITKELVALQMLLEAVVKQYLVAAGSIPFNCLCSL